MMGVYVILLIILFLALIAAVFSLNAMWHTLRTGLPFVTTPNWAIDWMADNLKLSTADRFYELGCGDARVTATLAKKFPDTKFVGIEIQWWPYLLAKWRARKLQNVRIIRDDVFKTNLLKATVIYGFYITNFAPRVAIKIRADARTGTKVVSYGFKFPNWKPVQEIPNPAGRGSQLIIYQT